MPAIDPSMTRRQFAIRSSATAAAAILGASALPLERALSADHSLPIVDTHQHLWDLSKFKLPWLNGAPEILNRTYVMADYLEATRGLNVVKAVYMEVDVDPSQQTAEAEHLIEICRSRKHPTVAAVISGRPNSAEFASYILKFKDSPYIRGVRQVLHAPDAKPGLCLEPQFVKSIQMLGELNMSYDICIRPGELADAVKLTQQCPGTRFVIDHCGNADPKAFLSEEARKSPPSHSVEDWKRQMGKLAEQPNTICKISGIIASAPKGEWKSDLLAPVVNYCLDQFGPDRVVFGGDWPVCLLGASYRRWVETLREIISNRSEQDQRKLLHDNAVKFYRLA